MDKIFKPEFCFKLLFKEKTKRGKKVSTIKWTLSFMTRYIQSIATSSQSHVPPLFIGSLYALNAYHTSTPYTNLPSCYAGSIDCLILYCLIDWARIVSGVLSQKIRCKWRGKPDCSWSVVRPDGCQGKRWKPRELQWCEALKQFWDAEKLTFLGDLVVSLRVASTGCSCTYDLILWCGGALQSVAHVWN